MTVSPRKTRVSRKERRKAHREGNNGNNHQNSQSAVEKLNFNIREIQPLTENQKIVFDEYDDGQHLLLMGSAGTGKTFLSIYLAMQDIMENKQQKKLVIVRNIVPMRDAGALPGSLKEKQAVYEAPYVSIFAEMFGRSDAYEYMKKVGVVEFITTSYVRGITLRDCIVVADEFQNFTPEEANSVFTRIGDNCKVIFSGDIRQNDLKNTKNPREVSGFSDFVKIISRMESFSIVEFQKEDIVRSKIVKEFLITREILEDSGEISSLI